MMAPQIDFGNHPALRDFKEIIPLSGFSGASVALVRDGGRPFVRKASNHSDTNESLRDQALRQQALAPIVAGCAELPSVLEMGEVEGVFFFDMQFVPSRDATNFLSHATFDSVAGFADRVEKLMERLAQSSATTLAPRSPSKSLVLEKLNQIAERTNGRDAETLAPLLKAVGLFDELAKEDRPTAVHGDLTFENILVDRRGELWLIDTISSPFDHYWIDWSKLFQECEGLWHVHRGRPLARGVTWWLRQRFYKAATRLDPVYPFRHYVLLGLTFARILPYTKNETDHTFVSRRVSECGYAALTIFGKDKP